jgi:hypothetical protein
MAFGYKPLAATFAELNRQMELATDREMAHKERMADLQVKQDERAYQKAQFNRYQKPILEQRRAEVLDNQKLVTPNIYNMSGSAQGNELLFKPDDTGRSPADYMLSVLSNGNPNVKWDQPTGNVIDTRTNKPWQIPNWKRKQLIAPAAAMALSRINPEDLIQSNVESFQRQIESAQKQLGELPKAGGKVDPKFVKQSLELNTQIKNLKVRQRHEASKLGTHTGLIRVNQEFIDKIRRASLGAAAVGVSPQHLQLFTQAAQQARGRINDEIEIMKIEAAAKEAGRDPKDMDRITIHNPKTGEEQSRVVPKDADFKPPKGFKIGKLPEEDKPKDLRASEGLMFSQIDEHYGERDENGQFFMTGPLKRKGAVAKKIARNLFKLGDKRRVAISAKRAGRGGQAVRLEDRPVSVDPGQAAVNVPLWLDNREFDYWQTKDRIEKSNLSKKDKKAEIKKLQQGFKRMLIDNFGKETWYIPTRDTRDKLEKG